MKSARSVSEHYVNNKEFSKAVMEYVLQCRASADDHPTIPRYIGESFIKIANGLSHKGNFRDYSYREEMVADAIENCVKAIRNYNIEAATRTGNPNAFAYFTQITYFAFLRRIAKEKKHALIRERFIERAGIDDVATVDEAFHGSLVEAVRNKTGNYRSPRYDTAEVSEAQSHADSPTE
jgi:hypothetical protein